MAIKKLRLSFDVPIADLLALVATRNDALHIDVVGDNKPDRVPKALRNGAAVAGLLEGPSKRGKHSKNKFRAHDEHGPLSTYQAIGIYLAKVTDHTSHMSDLKAALAQLGVNGVSISPQITVMRKDGALKQVAPGIYKLTTNGVHRFEKLMKERAQAAAKETQA